MIRNLIIWKRAVPFQMVLCYTCWKMRFPGGTKLTQSLLVPCVAQSSKNQLSAKFVSRCRYPSLLFFTHYSCQTLFWQWKNGCFVLQWLLQDTSLSRHLNGTSHPGLQQLLGLADHSRACHSEIKKGLALQFQSLLRERLKTLGGGNTCVSAHVSSKTTDGFNKVAPAARKWHFLTLAEPYLIRVLVSTRLAQQGRTQCPAWGNQGSTPISAPLIAPCQPALSADVTPTVLSVAGSIGFEGQLSLMICNSPYLNCSQNRLFRDSARNVWFLGAAKQKPLCSDQWIDVLNYCATKLMCPLVTELQKMSSVLCIKDSLVKDCFSRLDCSTVNTVIFPIKIWGVFGAASALLLLTVSQCKLTGANNWRTVNSNWDIFGS